MKINTAKLKMALDNLKRITPRRASLPILSCVLMKAENGYLEMTASNLDEYQLERVACDGDLAPCCVGRERLGYAIGGDETTIELIRDDMKVCYGRNEVTLKTQPADQFPEWPKFDFEAVGIPCRDVAEGIDAVSWAACANESRHTLMSVYIIGGPKSIECVSTNGYQLALWKGDLISDVFNALVPIASCANLCAALVNDGAEFQTSENMIQVEHDFGSYATKQIDGQYPDFRALTGSIANRIEIGSLKIAELMDIFNRCDFYSDPRKTPVASIEFSKVGAEIKSVGVDSGMVFFIDGSFQKWSIDVRPDAFKSCLRAIKSDSTKFFGASNIAVMEYGNVQIYTNGLRVESKESKKENQEDAK